MNRIIAVIILITISISSLSAQKGCINEYTNFKFIDLKCEEPDVQTYNATIKWREADPIEGKIYQTSVVKAIYSIMSNDTIIWNNVRMGKMDDIRQTDFNGKHLPALDNFSYKGKNDDFLKADFYKDIPAEHVDLARTLVIDAVQMQNISWYIVDSLEFKKEFIPQLMNDFDIDFEGAGTFSSDYQKYIWSGISVYNNKVCAIINFESFFNSMNFEYNGVTYYKGRSMYYGELWISLEDKQVEYSRMVEDVIRMLSPQNKLIDMQREIVFEKIR